MITKITTNEGAVKLYEGDNLKLTIPKGQFTLKPAIPDAIRIKVMGSGETELANIDTTLDDIEYDTIEELANALSNFSKGGGDGSGVTWEEIENKPSFIGAGTTQVDARNAIGAGTSNYVLPAGGTSTTFLRGDGTWVIPTNTTYAGMLQSETENISSQNLRLVSGQRLYQAYQSYTKGGIATFTGDDTTESFIIPHGLGVTPRFHICTRNADTGDMFTLFETMADATNITVKFQAPPMTGASIMINWMASK